MKHGPLNIVKNVFDYMHIYVSKRRKALSDLIHNKSNIKLGKRKTLQAIDYAIIEYSIEKREIISR